jgi:hypothetical protein
MLANQQIIMLAELAVNRALDNLQPQKIKRSQPSAAPTGIGVHLQELPKAAIF